MESKLRTSGELKDVEKDRELMDSEREKILNSFRMKKIEKWLEKVLIKNAEQEEPETESTKGSSKTGRRFKAEDPSNDYSAKPNQVHFVCAVEVVRVHVLHLKTIGYIFLLQKSCVHNFRLRKK